MIGRRDMKQIKQLCKEIIIGIAVWSGMMMVVLGIVSVFLHLNPIAMILGVLAGGVTASGLLLHMSHHLDIALDFSPDRAGRYTQFAAIKRMLVMAGVMAVSFVFSGYLHPAGVAFGILGMKVAALCYPKFHQFFKSGHG